MTGSSQSKPKVFISYAHGDEAYRDRVIKYLTSHGLDVEYDEHGLVLGKPWRDPLMQLINNCDAMLVLFTDKASESSWILYEFVWGLARGKAPIFLAPSETVPIPDPVKDVQGTILHGEFFGDEKRMSALIEALHNSAIKNREEKVTRVTEEWVDDELYGQIDNIAIIRSLVNTYVHNASQNNLDSPQIEHIQQSIKKLSHDGINQDILREVLASEIAESGMALQKFDTEHHQRQRLLGELLSQTSAPLDYLVLTDATVTVGDQTLRAFQYLVTEGVYYTYEQERYDKQVDSKIDNAKPHVFQLDKFAPSTELERNLSNTIRGLSAWLQRKLADDDTLGTVRLPTPQEWVEIARSEREWGYKALCACNLKSDRISNTKLSAVGAYPASCSEIGCYDIIGNVWELCKDSSGWYIAGWSYKNGVTADLITTNWNKVIDLDGKRLGDPVGVRFVVEVLPGSRV